MFHIGKKVCLKQNLKKGNAAEKTLGEKTNKAFNEWTKKTYGDFRKKQSEVRKEKNYR